MRRHAKPEAVAVDVPGAIENLRTAVKHCGRAMDLCDRQEIAAWRLLAEERGRLVELDALEIRLLRTDLAAVRAGVAS